MRFEQINDVLILWIDNNTSITFRVEWVNHLRSLPYDKFGEFMRTNIYSALNDTDRKIWNSITISNLDLQSAVLTYII